MTRKRLELTFIANDAKRRATLKKRKHGLMKKVNELSTLCGIEACAIVYSPDDPQPETWPSPRGVHRVLTRYKNMSELEQRKKKVDQESFLKQKVLKTKEQLQKMRDDNNKREMTLHMFQYLSAGKNICDNRNMIYLNDLSWLIDQNLKDINKRMARSQARVEAPLVADGEDMNEEKAPTGHGLGLERNVDAIQTEHWSLDLNNNDDDGGVTLPFGGVNLPNGSRPHP